MIITGVVALVVVASIISDLKSLKENCCVRPITYNKFLLLSVLIIAMMLNSVLTH